MKKFCLILAVVFLIFGLTFGCSKKKKPQDSNQPSQTIQTGTVDPNSITDVNDPKLNRAIEKTKTSQTAERRPRDQ